MTPYYYVYRWAHGQPIQRHTKLTDAVIEAERLAQKHPGETFEILECVAMSKINPSCTFWMDGKTPDTTP